MRAAADVLIVARAEAGPRERGGAIGKVLAIVRETPGLTTGQIIELVREPGDRVSGALNKLKLEGAITPRDFEAVRYEWIPGAGPHAHGYTAPVEPAQQPFTAAPSGPEVFCPCGMSILFGPLASDAERAEPKCSRHPFACRGPA